MICYSYELKKQPRQIKTCPGPNQERKEQRHHQRLLIHNVLSIQRIWNDIYLVCAPALDFLRKNRYNSGHHDPVEVDMAAMV